MAKRLFLGIGFVAFSVCALVWAQGKKVMSVSNIGIVEGVRNAGGVMVPLHMNYQGYLTDIFGIPSNGNLNMDFSIWTTSTGGTQLWNEGQVVSVENGLFNVVLGTNPIPPSVFEPGVSRWFQLAVEAETLLPRTEITSAGFAYRSIKADTADYALSAPSLPDSDWTVNGNVLYPMANYGLAMRSSNVLYGTNNSTHVNFGVSCTTGTSGQNYSYCTVNGGNFNAASYNFSTVGGGYSNSASALNATVSGGQINTASGSGANVGGGFSNTASGNYATVGGGIDNTASNSYSTVSGGDNNTASGMWATVGGGYGDTVAGNASFAAGYQVRVSSAAVLNFAFGRNFTTSTPYAVVFHSDIATFRMGIGVTDPAYPLHMGSGAYCSAGGVWTDASSREYKENIEDLSAEEALKAVNRLRPVSFDYKKEKGDRSVGFIAEDVPDLVATKDRKGLSPMDIVAVLTKVLQVQQKEIESLRKDIEALKK